MKILCLIEDQCENFSILEYLGVISNDISLLLSKVKPNIIYYRSIGTRTAVKLIVDMNYFNVPSTDVIEIYTDGTSIPDIVVSSDLIDNAHIHMILDKQTVLSSTIPKLDYECHSLYQNLNPHTLCEGQDNKGIFHQPKILDYQHGIYSLSWNKRILYQDSIKCIEAYGTSNYIYSIFSI